MARDNKQEPDQQEEQGGSMQEHAPQANTTDRLRKDAVDLASINAAAADESGEFVRESKKNIRKKDVAEQEVHTKDAATKKPSEKNKENQEGYTVPVLRTYQQDTKHMAQTTGGAELRTILAKEAEEKRQAQAEYLRKTRDIMKESVVLRDRYNNFVKGRQGQQGVEVPAQKASGSIDTGDIDQESVTRVLSGATAYMQSTQGNNKKQQKGKPKQPTTDAAEPLKEKQPRPDTRVEGSEEKAPSSAETPSDQATEKRGIFARARGRMLPKDVFTEEKRESLKQKQQEVTEKVAIQDAWKDFKQKKEKLQQMGLQARDVRSYAASPDEKIPNKPLRGQNMLLLAIVFFLLAGLISSVIFLAVSPAEKPITSNSTEETTLVPDVLNSENKVFVDTVDEIVLSDTWQSITEKDGEQNTITKYVPHRQVGEEEAQINFQDFSDTFNVRFPAGLQNAFDDYYFVGKYLTQTDVSGIFIASIKKYGDAFVWIRNWESNILNAFSDVFPNFFQESKVSNVTVESRIIDNQDVRVIRNPTSQKEMFYYFFGRSILVFVAGEESVIPLINARIRSTNTF